MIAFEVLQPPAAPGFASMTFPAYRHLLALEPARRHPEDRNRPVVQPLAVAAVVRGQAVGLALVELPLAADGEAELLSLFVAPHLRNVGVGAALLAAAETEVCRRGFRRLATVYMTGKPGIAAFERLLAKRGWQAPATRTVTVRFTVEDIDRFPWLDRYPLLSGAEIFPWSELTDPERRRLRESQERSPWIARDLQPWDHDSYGFEPATSIGMRTADGVVGWVINHAISASLLRFTCSFIRKDLGRRGRIVPLFSESLARMKRTAFTHATFVAPVQHPTMVHFVAKWMGPWVSFLGETRGSARSLVPPDPSRLPTHEPGSADRGAGVEPGPAARPAAPAGASSQPPNDETKR